MELFLIRHGRSFWNHERRIQGHRDPRLSPQGLSDARHLAAGLKMRLGTPTGKKYVLVSSPLRRAHETARVLSRVIGLPVVRRPALKETSLGEWEGKLVADIRRVDAGRLARWYRDPTRVRLKGAEGIAAFRRRVRREIQSLLYIYGEADRMLIVTHGGWISTLLTDVVGIPLGRMWTFVVDNCSLTRLHWDGKKLFLRSFNEASPAPHRRPEVS